MALLIKRFNIYKRDKCGLVCELVVPVILVIFGLGLLQISWLENPPAFQLTTDAYPGPQRILVNRQNSYTGDPAITQYEPTALIEALPSYPDYWTVSYNDDDNITYEEFYSAYNAT